MQADIAKNIGDFMQQLKGLTADLDEDYRNVHGEAYADLFDAIVDGTPEDTGNAKVNWHITTGDNTGEVVPYNRYVKVSGLEADKNRKIESFLNDFLQGENVSVVTMFNNANHISFLEDGHSSTQAPNGMVSVALEDFVRYLKKAASGSRFFK